MSNVIEKINIKNKYKDVPSFNEFIFPYRVTKADKDLYKSTHTSLSGCHHRAGSYHIPTDINPELYDVIYKHVYLDGKELHLTESHQGFSYSPLIDDIDTRNPHTAGEPLVRYYTDETIRDYCVHLVESLEKYCNLTDKQRLVYVFQKSTPALDPKSGLVKDGWHIMMPHLVAPFQLFYLARSNRIMNSSVRELFEKLGYSNPIQDIIDHCVIEQNNWFMYGAGKPSKETYKLTKIYKIVNSTAYEISIKVEGLDDPRKAIELFSVRNKELNVEFKEDIDIFEIYKKIPAIHRSAKDGRTKKQTEIKIKEKKAKARLKPLEMNKTDIDLDLIADFVSCLNVNRAHSYHDWIRVGWCLHNIDFCLLDTWIEFSKQSPKYQAGECEERWYQMRNQGLGYGTLRMWARNDNPKRYEEIKKGDLQTLLQKCFHKGHTCISDYIKAKYEDEFVCASIINKEWYQFKGHRWCSIEEGYTLREKIAKEVGMDFQLYGMEAYHKMTKMNSNFGGRQKYRRLKTKNNDDDEDDDDLFKQIISEQTFEQFKAHHKAFSDMANRIGDHAMLNNLMNECKFRFYIEEFKNKLDENTDLVHFNNGVYDLAKHEFREGYPEDYLSLSTNIDFIEDLNDDDYDVLDEIHNFLDQVFPIQRVKEYALTLMGSFLSGKNDQQKFFIWTGSGSNGKSMTIDLFEGCLGDYADSISVAIFTKGRPDANGPTPAIAKLKGKRFISLQETEEGDKLHMSMIKQWSGGDMVDCRELHKAPIKFRILANMVLVCNDLPTVDATDGGTWRRLRLLEFISKFVDNPKGKYQYHRDNTLKERMENWKEVFMWMLIRYNKMYRQKGIEEPPEVMRVSDEYKENSNLFAQFVKEHLIRDNNSSLTINDAFSYYKQWHKNTYEGKKLAIRQNFIKQMSVLLGKVMKNKWLGWRYVEEEEDDEETGHYQGIDDDKDDKKDNDIDDNDKDNSDEEEDDADDEAEYEVIKPKKNKKSSKKPRKIKT